MTCQEFIYSNINKTQNENIPILCVFGYGSRVYGSNDNESDYDYIVIVSDDCDVEEQMKMDDGDISFYTHSQFKKLLETHEISALECLWETYYVYSTDYQSMYRDFFNTIFNRTTLRKSISAKANNAWAKFHKKLTVEKDYNYRIGIKSLFHSIRLYIFGWQIATRGYIYDFSMANDIWKEIQSYPQDTSFEDLKEIFKPIYNKWHSLFVQAAPKE